jgi:hypothetical protein
MSTELPLYSALTLTNYMDCSKGTSSDYTTSFSIFHLTIKLTLDKLLGEESNGKDFTCSR